MQAMFDAYRSWSCFALLLTTGRTCACVCVAEQSSNSSGLQSQQQRMLLPAVKTGDNIKLQMNHQPCVRKSPVLFSSFLVASIGDTFWVEQIQWRVATYLKIACMKYLYKTSLHAVNIWTIKNLFTAAFWPWAKLRDWLEDGDGCSLPAEWYLWDHSGTDGKTSKPRALPCLTPAITQPHTDTHSLLPSGEDTGERIGRVKVS